MILIINYMIYFIYGDYMNESLLYRIVRPLVSIYVKLFYRPTYIGLDNIPKDNKVLLVGTHTSTRDGFLLMSATKRPIHFLAKQELWKFPTGIIIKNLGLIPVNRSVKDSSSLVKAKEYLDNDKVVLIFPEGTTEKEYGKLLPFKMGAFKLAKDTNTPIIPFAISGHYYKKDLKIVFGKEIIIKDDLEKEKDKFIKIIQNMRGE